MTVRSQQRLQRQRTRRSPLRWCLLGLCVLSGALGAQTDGDGDGDGFVWTGAPRIVVIGDVHGAYEPLLALLRGVGLISERNAWIGGDTHLVSLGDLIDHGEQSRFVLDLMMSLERQAEDAGGKVHVLLGNHELMNLAGDWRDVSETELESYAPGARSNALRARRSAFYRYGQYGSWLLQRPLFIRIDDRLFTHGGLSPLLLSETLPQANDRTVNLLRSLVVEGEGLVEGGVLSVGSNLLDLAFLERKEGEDLGLRRARILAQADYLSAQSPLWYRGTSLCHPVIEHDLTEAVLQRFGAQSVVIGHSPTWNHAVHRRMGGRVWRVDTGMLNERFNGQPLALEFQGDAVQVRNSAGESVPFYDEPFVPQSGNKAADTRLALLTSASLVPVAPGSDAVNSGDSARRYRKDRLVNLLDADGQPLGQARFRPLRESATARELAAFRLDRRLGLGLVPATIATSVDGKAGVLQWLDSDRLTERARQAEGRTFPNWCGRGNDYQVVEAFDALIDQRERSADNLSYVHGLSRIRLSDHAEAFGSRKRIAAADHIRYLSKTLRDRLGALDQDSLQTLFDGLLPDKAITALLKRRDTIVTWPILRKPRRGRG